MGYVVDAEVLKGQGFFKLRIRLATDFSKLKHVYVIDNKFREEQKELTE